MCVICSQGQLLGEMNGTLKAIAKTQQEHGAKIDSLDARLRTQENRSAVAGAVAALMVTLGIDLIKTKFFKG
jgi:rhamnogalacturonyl hydrolase YesR